SQAIYWLHGPYRRAIREAGIPEGSIYKSSVTGKMGQIGRVWHRMYPWVRKVKSKDNPNIPIPLRTPKFIELLTIFPDQSSECRAFLRFLEQGESNFQKLWG
ncbi:MAG: RAMP superfamily protein, partial [Cyanobacteria bacterium P01_H01_bin.121]